MPLSFELHSRGLANSDHTTLLLNTYTKLKDVTRLDASTKAESSTVDGELPFDLDTAIRVCRQAGYYEHAVYLAKKHGKHEDYLRIQIEDAHRYKDALDYLRSLGPAAVCSFLSCCSSSQFLYPPGGEQLDSLRSATIKFDPGRDDQSTRGHLYWLRLRFASSASRTCCPA